MASVIPLRLQSDRFFRRRNLLLESGISAWHETCCRIAQALQECHPLNENAKSVTRISNQLESRHAGARIFRSWIHLLYKQTAKLYQRYLVRRKCVFFHRGQLQHLGGRGFPLCRHFLHGGEIQIRKACGADRCYSHLAQKISRTRTPGFQLSRAFSARRLFCSLS
jgi:hypothetical protein